METSSKLDASWGTRSAEDVIIVPMIEKMEDNNSLACNNQDDQFSIKEKMTILSKGKSKNWKRKHSNFEPQFVFKIWKTEVAVFLELNIRKALKCWELETPIYFNDSNSKLDFFFPKEREFATKIKTPFQPWHLYSNSCIK